MRRAKRWTARWLKLTLIASLLALLLWAIPVTDNLSEAFFRWLPLLIAMMFASAIAVMVRSAARWLTRRDPDLYLHLLSLLTTVAAAAVTATIVVPRSMTALHEINAATVTLYNAAQHIEDFTLDDYARLQTSTDTLNHYLLPLRQYARFVEPLSQGNPDASHLLYTLYASHELMLAMDNVLDGFEPALRSVDQNTGGAPGTLFTVALDTNQHFFSSASTHLQHAERYITQLDPDHHPAFLETLPVQLPTAAGIRETYAAVEQMNSLLLQAPPLLNSLLGLSETKHYLVLSQNNDEIRPSGGYISTYGWVRVVNGEIVASDYQPTTEHSPVPPSAEFQDFLTIPDWWLTFQRPISAAWDGSWSADFPTTARMARWFYEEGENPIPSIDGIIGIDITGFEYLVGALGSVNVPEYQVTVTADNFRHVIYDIRAQGIQADGLEEMHHKRFLATLYQQIINDLQAAYTGDNLYTKINIIKAALLALEEKHLMLYPVDAGLRSFVSAAGWTGAQSPARDHDYLMVADANLSNKSSRSIQRHIIYAAQITPEGTLNSRTTIQYSYPAHLADDDPAVIPENYNTLRLRDYNNLFQLHVPAHSQLQTSQTQWRVDTLASNRHTTFVTFGSTRYDSSAAFSFDYTTPVLVSQRGNQYTYRLLLQKQPGQTGERIEVHLTLPPGASLIATAPQAQLGAQGESLTLEFEQLLNRDEWIEVIYEIPQRPRLEVAAAGVKLNQSAM